MKYILILCFISCLLCGCSNQKISKIDKPEPLLLEVDWPGGEHELELEIHPNLIDGEEPFVNAGEQNVIMMKAPQGKQVLKIYIKPIIRTHE